MPILGSLPSPLPSAPGVSTHSPGGRHQNSNQDIVTRVRARGGDTHKRLSRPVAQDREGWRRGPDSPSPPPGGDPPQEAQPLPEGLAEDEAGEESSSPKSLGAKPLAPGPPTERPVYSRDQRFSPVLEGLLQAPAATLEFAQSLINCS